MVSKPVVIVAGLGRCGTSLVMQMLDAAGIPCVGRFPAFEEDDPWVGTGRAVKWLDPHRRPLRVAIGSRYRCIWLSRDPVEQARSQLKWFSPEMLTVGVDEATRVLAESLRDESVDALRRLPLPRLMTTFEAIIGRPRASAARIADFLGRPFAPLDVDAMAARVIPRGPECQPDLSIEATLVRLAEGVFV